MREYLNPAETALVIVDVQNDFCHEEGACAKRGDDVTAAQAMKMHMLPAIRSCIPWLYRGLLLNRSGERHIFNNNRQ
ncbi:hypothetical protein [Alicyclobacillus kakegawensis]|uniref:hypothetical protein n=1 Tax=Alicyclobacillus kakegawensis TaxID=392012 RepID=UPI00082A0243|nr:hypothetical protein [Alicyclobacillus kakegawensis]